jgi:predicted RND superfamily exporter protein
MTRQRLAVLLLAVVVAGLFAVGIFKIRGEVILQELFPYNHPYLRLHARFAQVFGSGGSGVVVAIRAKQGDIFNRHILTKIQDMNNEVVLWDEVYRVLTISIANRSVKVVKALSAGKISIEPLMWPDVPKNDDEMAGLKKHIFSNPAYNGTLVARDGTATLLLTEFKENISYEQAFNRLCKLVDDYTDDHVSVHVIGFPMLMGWIYSYKPQILFVSAVSVGLMLLVLLVIFRSFGGIVAPIAFGIICTAMGLGFIGWTGINFSPLLYVLAFLVGARMVSHSVQLTHRYFEEYARVGDDKIEACYETMRAMIIPNWAGVATDAAGFLVLIFAKIALMQMVAIFMSFWMLCIALCGILTPILCSYVPIGKASNKHVQGRTEADWLDRFCLASARFSVGSGRTIVIAVCMGALVFCLWQASRLKIGDPTPGTPLLWPDHQYNQDQEFVDQTFDASSENFMLFYEGAQESVYDPVVLTTFQAFARHMQTKLPDIYKSSSSITNMVKMINVTFHDGDKLWYQLPRNEPMLMGLMGFVRDSTDRGTLNRFMDSTLERTQITLFFSDHTSENLLRIRESAYDFFRDRPMKLEKGEFKLAGGRIGLEIAVNEEMKRSHLLIDSMVLAAIFVLCALAFYSVVGGLMLTVPLILANLVAFAYMALMNIGLSINTLPVAAVGVGVGVDFAIYIYSRCIDEFPRQEGWHDTIMAAVGTSGKAVVYTGLTMVLPIMTWYFISDLKFQAHMGIFLSMIIGTNVIFAITLHPLLIALVKPRFIQRASLNRRSNHKE